jgi:hypothetical protein
MYTRPLPLTPHLNALLRYEPETGKLFWRERPREMFSNRRAHSTFNARFAGKEAFTATSRGYRVGRIDDVLYVAHRVIWAMTHGRDPSEDIDHSNGDRGDNRLSNLREATRSENLCNRPTPPANTSGHKGVFLDKRTGKWRAHIKKNRVMQNLGSFDRLEDALAARHSAVLRLHGDFACAA